MHFILISFILNFAREKSLSFGSAIFSSFPCLHKLASCRRPAKNCNHCPMINHTGRITSTYTGVGYSCKKNVTCKSSNLALCIQCKSCKMQYVGETSTTIMKRMQGHLDRIQRKVLSDDIGKHFNLPNHNGKSDLELFVLDFIFCDPQADFAKSLRLLIENNWIHRLRSQLPHGINTMQSVKEF